MDKQFSRGRLHQMRPLDMALSGAIVGWTGILINWRDRCAYRSLLHDPGASVIGAKPLEAQSKAPSSTGFAEEIAASGKSHLSGVAGSDPSPQGGSSPACGGDPGRSPRMFPARRGPPHTAGVERPAPGRKPGASLLAARPVPALRAQRCSRLCSALPAVSKPPAKTRPPIETAPQTHIPSIPRLHQMRPLHVASSDAIVPG